METTGAILLHDVEGDKFDTGTKFTLKKLIFGYAPQAKIKVLSGELLIGIKLENSPYNYILSRYSNVYLHVVGENHVAPLNGEEFSLLEAIGKPCDRLEAFNNKLEWGTELKEKARVRVAVRAPNLSVEERARAVLHYKGKIGNLPSTHFGVELMVSSKIYNVLILLTQICCVNSKKNIAELLLAPPMALIKVYATLVVKMGVVCLYHFT